MADWELAMEMTKRFEERGVAPNTVACNALINALGSAGQWQKVDALWGPHAAMMASSSSSFIVRAVCLTALMQCRLWRSLTACTTASCLCLGTLQMLPVPPPTMSPMPALSLPASAMGSGKQP